MMLLFQENVKFYYQKWVEDQAQSLIDATTAAFKAGKLPGAGPHAGVAIPPPGKSCFPVSSADNFDKDRR